MCESLPPQLRAENYSLKIRSIVPHFSVFEDISTREYVRRDGYYREKFVVVIIKLIERSHITLYDTMPLFMTSSHSSWPRITSYVLCRSVKDTSILLDSGHRPWTQELASNRTTSLPWSARKCDFLYLDEARELTFFIGPTPALSEPDDLSILINTAPEHVSNDSAPENRLVDDTLNVLRLNPAIPDPLPGQGMLLPISHKLPGRDIDDDVPGKLVPANMANQPNPRRHLLIPPLTILRRLRRRNPPSLLTTLINHNRPPQNINPNPLKPPLKLIPQHGPHDAAPHIPPAVPANQHQHLLHVPDPVQQRPVGLLARQPVPVDGRQAPVVHLVQLLREQVALCEGLDAVEAHARQEGHVLEAREEVGARGLQLAPPGHGGGEGGV
ncbi:hypothetical protein CSIM01_10530 [Colletotrichum simmondsii]|uniref:Uncharacterized protein n=1 Tax=Colletotrichum simmondsii TaxID=703756 RepID=A0A135TPC1_9PEZI|nr:hypothetical protein CSIM01_10530 [Colletotrichum simmondsii]